MPSRLLIVAIALAAAVGITFEQQQFGLDFYHFWGIEHARSRGASGSPYERPESYAAVLNAEADAIWLRYVERARLDEVVRDYRRVAPTLGQLAAGQTPEAARELWEQSRYLTANARRRSLDPTGTPLSYAVMAFLPASYPDAMALWGWIQIACFLSAGTLLGRALGRDRAESLLFAAIAAAGFLPFRTDVQVGNVGAPHLLLAAAAVWVAAHPLARREAGRRALPAALVAVLAVLHGLFKPSLPLLTLALLAHALVAAGRGARLLVLAAAGSCAALVLAATSYWYRSPGLWLDWLAYITGDGSKLAYDLERGNLASSQHLAGWCGGVPAGWFTVGIAIVLLALGLLLATRVRSRAISDPFAACSLGLVASLALSPLVWGHYLTAALVPIAWIGLSPRARAAEVVPLVCFALLFSPLRDALPQATAMGDTQAAWRALAALSWVALAWASVARSLRTVP